MDGDELASAIAALNDRISILSVEGGLRQVTWKHELDYAISLHRENEQAKALLERLVKIESGKNG